MKKSIEKKKRRKKPIALSSEIVKISQLKKHSRNYRTHPPDQIAHLKSSIEQFGFFKNVVVAKDLTLLAGHGAVLAAEQLGYEEIPVVKLNLKADDPKALKVLAADNEIEHLADQDDRVLSELLKEINDKDDLLGTGFDEMMLANLVFVTRPESEIGSKHDATQWVGMPGYEESEECPKLVIRFETQEDKIRFCKRVKLKISEDVDSIWWPERPSKDLTSVKFE